MKVKKLKKLLKGVDGNLEIIVLDREGVSFDICKECTGELDFSEEDGGSGNIFIIQLD